MSKFIKVLTAVSMVAAIAVSAMPVSVSAEEKIAEPYTLEQLFAMSDEDFLKLEGAKSLYDEKLIDTNSPFKDTTGTLYYWIGGSADDGSYSMGKTEKELSALLGDAVKYELVAPTENIPEDEKTDDNTKISYSSAFEVVFPDYAVSEEDMESFDSMKFAKCRYCVDQVIPTKYIKSGVPIGIMYKTSVKGDLDKSGMVDIADVTYVAKNNIGAVKLNSEEKLIGDMNGDAVIDAVDLSALIEINLGK